MRQAACISEETGEPNAPKSTRTAKCTQTDPPQSKTTGAAAEPEKFCPPCQRRGFLTELLVKRAVHANGIFMIPWCERCSYLGPSRGPFSHRKFWGCLKSQSKPRQARRPAPPRLPLPYFDLAGTG